MKIFFAGNHFEEGGPWNVNKDIVAHLKGRAKYTQCLNKPLRLLEILWKILFSQVIIFSGVSSIDHITVRFAKILRRKVIYIMHGCIRLEYKANRKTDNTRGEKNELINLSLADRILCVSPLYCELMKKTFPEYADKMGVLINGINWAALPPSSEQTLRTQPNTIALMGGGRVTKRNLQVCQAVERLNAERHTQITVEVYGYHTDTDDSNAIQACSCVKFFSSLSHHELLLRLQQQALFIQNSDLESFSLGVIEALACGCSVLMSRYVGAKCIIPALVSEDLIDNPLDIDELMRKILYVLQHPNHARLYNSINKQETSSETAVKRLIQEVVFY